MNKFEESIKNNFFEIEEDRKLDMKLGWHLCKEEILKIIYKSYTLPSIVPAPEYYPLEDIIKKIKEL